MEARTSTARLLHGPENPLGEREIEVAASDDGVDLRPVVDVDGTRHELRLVSFADGEGMPEYVYERQVHDDGDPQGFSIPGGDLDDQEPA
jgi:hypothetical protein